MHEVLVNRLGGLSLPRKSVVRLTDRPDMTLGVYRGRKTTKQTKQHCQTCQVPGPTISSDLSWNRHIDNTIKKATNSLNFLKRNIRDCPPRVKEQFYKSLVRPVAEYAALVLDVHTSSNISKLEMVKRRTIRFVKEDSDRTSSVTSMLNNLGPPSRA